MNANQRIMWRIIDTIVFLGKQEHSFRGHIETLAADPSVNVGNFLEVFKFLSCYDQTIADHLETVRIEHGRLLEVNLSAVNKMKKKLGKLAVGKNNIFE